MKVSKQELKRVETAALVIGLVTLYGVAVNSGKVLGLALLAMVALRQIVRIGLWDSSEH